MPSARIFVRKVKTRQRFVNEDDGLSAGAIGFIKIAPLQERNPQCLEIARLNHQYPSTRPGSRRSRPAFDFKKWRDVVRDRFAAIWKLDSGAGSSNAGNLPQFRLYFLEGLSGFPIFS